MKLSGFLERYYTYSRNASAIARQLAFGGIAIAWLFKTNGENGIILPKSLAMGMLFLSIALALDLFQYFLSSIIWDLFHRHHEKKKLNEDDDPVIVAPVYFKWPGTVFFYSKIVLVLIGYMLKYPLIYVT